MAQWAAKRYQRKARHRQRMALGQAFLARRPQPIDHAAVCSARAETRDRSAHSGRDFRAQRTGLELDERCLHGRVSVGIPAGARAAARINWRKLLPGYLSIR
jgi:hypothetical protein